MGDRKARLAKRQEEEMSVADYEENDVEVDDDTTDETGLPATRQRVASAPRRAPAKPGDLLPERRTMARQTFGKPPSAQRLREHAEKHGVDGVAETAAESGMNEESLTALILSLDRINATLRRDPKKKNLYRTPAKKSADRRARELLGIEEPDVP